MAYATEVRLCDARITFWENGEPRWNRKVYNESLVGFLNSRGFGDLLTDRAIKVATEAKLLLPDFFETPEGLNTVRAWPSRAELHAAATKRPDPAPFDSCVVVFRPRQASRLAFGPEFTIWNWTRTPSHV